MKKLKFCISGCLLRNDGMSLHQRTLVNLLNNKGIVKLLEDANKEKEDYLNQFDFIFRHGWASNINNDFRNAVFSYNISVEKRKNVLIVPFDARMLGSKPIKEIYKNFEKIIYDSSFSQEKGNFVFGNLQSVVVNPCLLDINLGLKSSSQQTEASSLMYQFIHVSNSLYWIKGVDILVEAFLEAFNSSDNVRLNLILKNKNDEFSRIGRKFANLKRLSQLNLFDNTINHLKMWNIYNKMDCYICVSRSDTFSIPTLEASAMGLTVIGHKFGGMRDYLKLLPKNKFLELETQKIIAPRNIWRKNRSVVLDEPTKDSVIINLKTAFNIGKQTKKANQVVLRQFNVNKYQFLLDRFLSQ